MGTEEVVTVDEAAVISDLENKIIRQVEYYFGNYNLYKDKFLREQIKENDGWIPMDTMVKFKRLKMLSEDFAVITAALKKSPNKLMEVSEDGTKIRRNVEIPLPENSEERRQDIDLRSVYVKGFNGNTSLDELLEFFKAYGNPENIHMRRRPNKKFKGSVFVTFRTKEDAEKFQQMKNVTYKSTELLKEMKQDYMKRKDEWFEGLKKEREEKKRRQQEQKDKNGDTSRESSVEVTEDNIQKGCLLKLSGLSETTMWEHIKEVLSPHGSIAYVDYSRGKPEAVVRFDSGVAAEVLEKVATGDDDVKTVKIKGNDAVPVVLEGLEELEYWKAIAKSKADLKHKQSHKGWQNRGGRSGGGGRGRGRYKGKRRHRDDDNENEDNEDSKGLPRKVFKKDADSDVTTEAKCEA